MDFWPLFVRMEGKLVLVVGGGGVATRKVRSLCKTGARLKVVAPQIRDELRLLAKHRTVTVLERTFDDDDIAEAFLVIAATSDAELNRRIGSLCRARGIIVNNVDSSEDSSFIFPTLIDRSPIRIALATGGASPLLARMLAKHIENCTPETYGQLATLIGRYREAAKRAFSKVAERRLFWERVLQSRVAELVFSGDFDAAEAKLVKMLEEHNLGRIETGEVYLVGAGPGDPDLLTFKAMRLMQQSDVVFYDRLVSKEILALLPDNAEKIYAGKERSRHSIPQETLNTMLVRYAREGHRVLRLKGGDPFIFGRGGEEIASLLEEKISFQIVPGITAASGCAAYAGIPLTHRDYAHSCVFVTGHLKDGSIELNWEMLAQAKQTNIFYMGLQGLDEICRQLIRHGLPEDLPAALITSGTTPQQMVFTAGLGNIAELVSKHDAKPPTLLITGEVVKLHDKLRWYRTEEDVQVRP